MLQVLRVNVSTDKIGLEPVPAAWERVAGRALIARVMLDEVPGECDPCGPDNKLIFAPGVLVGQMVSSCDRLSIGGKSPLTGGVKESNCGGSTGLHIVWLGLKAILVEGSPPAGAELRLLCIGPDGAHFEACSDVIGLGVHETTQRLRKRFGSKVSIAMIGPAGEMRMRGAGIMHLDKDGNPGRISARGAMGVLMAAKGLKAVIIDPGKTRRPVLADAARHNAARKLYVKALAEHPQTSKIYTEYGTASIVDMCNGFGAMPTRNFSNGKFEHAEKINGDAFHDLMVGRGGEGDPSHACMAGCTIQCSNIYADVNGKQIVSPVEYETIGLVGSNLGISEPDVIAHLNYQMNDLGLDTIETGAALGVAAEAGVMEWGDGQRAMELMEEVRKGTALGRVIGNGAKLAGEVFGVQRVPVVKGQAISAYDPRAIKGTGVTYATSPQGADHTAGLTLRMPVDHLKPEGQVAASRTAQIRMAGFDSLGACIFGAFGFNMAPTTIQDLVNGQHGWEVGADYLTELGRATIELEREFNRRAGFTPADDRLPEWMALEALAPNNTVFDVPPAEMDAIYNW
jgi:aldehyde:ferredoxin oxidoreductase